MDGLKVRGGWVRMHCLAVRRRMDVGDMVSFGKFLLLLSC